MINKISFAKTNCYQNKKNNKGDINFKSEYCFIIPHGIDLILIKKPKPKFFHQQFLERLEEALTSNKEFVKKIMPHKRLSMINVDNKDYIMTYVLTGSNAEKVINAQKTGATPEAIREILANDLTPENLTVPKNKMKQIVDFANQIFEEFGLKSRIRPLEESFLDKPIWTGEEPDFTDKTIWKKFSYSPTILAK